LCLAAQAVSITIFDGASALTYVKSIAPVIGTFRPGQYCNGMQTFMLVLFDTLAVAAIVAILICVKPVH
jgi:hypothetical protein